MPGLEGRRILIVEDDALIAMMIEDILREAGAEVIGPAAGVVEALRLITTAGLEGISDAAVLDVGLQDGTVLPVADELATLNVPFVFATGYEDLQLGRHLHAPVLVKPIAYEGLVVALANLLNGCFHYYLELRNPVPAVC